MVLFLVFIALLALVAGLGIVFLFLISYKVPQEFEYEKHPGIGLMFAVGLCKSFLRKEGTLSPEVEGVTPRIRARNCRIKAGHLREYKNVCGYDPNSTDLPPAFLEVFFLPLLTAMAISDGFRLSPVILVHMGTKIVHHSDCQHLLAEDFDLDCSLVGYRQVERGFEVDISCKVYDKKQLCVYECGVVLLSRNAETRRGKSRKPKTQGETKSDAENLEGSEKILEFSCAGDLGIKYAQVSLDWSPHHLPFACRFMGYKQPIAQGMFTVAKSCALLQKHDMFPKGNFVLDIVYKRPLFMPGTSELKVVTKSDALSRLQIRVSDKKTGAPQLVGSIQSTA